MLADFFCGILKYAMLSLFLFLVAGVLYAIFAPLGIVFGIYYICFVFAHMYEDIKYYFRY